MKLYAFSDLFPHTHHCVLGPGYPADPSLTTVQVVLSVQRRKTTWSWALGTQLTARLAPAQLTEVMYPSLLTRNSIYVATVTKALAKDFCIWILTLG